MKRKLFILMLIFAVFTFAVFSTSVQVAFAQEAETAYTSSQQIIIEEQAPEAALKSAPSSVRAKATGMTTATVTWRARKDAVSYNVYRSEKSRTGYVKIATVTETGFSDSNLTPYKYYYYKVSANMPDTGETRLSPAKKIRTFLPMATVSKISFSSIKSNSVRIVWKSVRGAKRYAIYRSESPSEGFVQIAFTKSRSFTDKSLMPGVTYYYKVQSICAYDESELSAAFNVTTKGVKAAETTSNTEKKNSVSPTTAKPEKQTPAQPAAVPQTTNQEQQSSKVVVQPGEKPKFSTAGLSKGYIEIAYNSVSGKTLKVMTELDGQRQTSNFTGDGAYHKVPLSQGYGTYKVSLLENIEGNTYRYLASETVKHEKDDGLSKYLLSIREINWNASMAPIKKAAELCEGKSSDSDKAKAIYNFVVRNIAYDYNALGNLPQGRTPDIEVTYSTGKGVCYDFAVLFAAMCRSQGIPCKLVKGYSDAVAGYHAWNEVYVDGKWRIVDTSSDSQYRKAGMSYSMYKSSKVYHTKSSVT